MLTVIEKRGFFQILNKLSVEEVLSLRDTVTKKQITTVGKIEAITAITTYTERAVELLRRKKVKRDVLFQYLVDCEVVVAVTAEKHQLIDRILTFWGSSFDSSEIEESASQGSLTDTCTSVTTSNVHDITRDCASYQSSPAHHQPQSNQHRSILHSSSLDVIASSQEIYCRNTIETTVSTDPTCIQDEKFVLGKQFIEWFYKILNSHNPSLQDIPDGEFGPQHFWQDCKLDLQFSVQGETNVENYEGAMLVAQRFLALVKEERLLFNPNSTPDGIKVKSSPHGLLLVMTCGTIHRVDNCLGIFEQVFGLISDPLLDNNWKVKMSHLKMTSSQQPTMPKLESGHDKTLAIYCDR